MRAGRTPFLWGLLLLAALCLSACAADDVTGRAFAITVDQTMWKRWGFQYPATYVFEAPSLPPDVQVCRRDAPAAGWSVIPQKTAADFFNGIECVRMARDNRRLLVSVGFAASNVIELKFENVADVKYLGIARYYDDRSAAYSLSIDNWGRRTGAHPGARWLSATDDQSDSYQAALHVCRGFHLPVSIAINTRMAGSSAMWEAMQRELALNDFSWEPAVHAQTHPGSAKGYTKKGYKAEVLGCRDEILQRLSQIPFGHHIFEHILTSGYVDDTLLDTDAADFLFVRGYNGRDNPESTAYAAWDQRRRLFGVGGKSAKDFDRVFARRTPKGRFFAADVAELNAAFDAVYKAGGICYAMWHPDRYLNSVVHDPRPGVDGVQGSTLIQHLGHVANRPDVWYVANGWLYLYRYVAENASVSVQRR